MTDPKSKLSEKDCDPDNCVLALIDHQPRCSSAYQFRPQTIINNTVASRRPRRFSAFLCPDLR